VDEDEEEEEEMGEADLHKDEDAGEDRRDRDHRIHGGGSEEEGCWNDEGFGDDEGSSDEEEHTDADADVDADASAVGEEIEERDESTPAARTEGDHRMEGDDALLEEAVAAIDEAEDTEEDLEDVAGFLLDEERHFDEQDEPTTTAKSGEESYDIRGGTPSSRSWGPSAAPSCSSEQQLQQQHQEEQDEEGGEEVTRDEVFFNLPQPQRSPPGSQEDVRQAADDIMRRHQALIDAHLAAMGSIPRTPPSCSTSSLSSSFSPPVPGSTAVAPPHVPPSAAAVEGASSLSSCSGSEGAEADVDADNAADADEDHHADPDPASQDLTVSGVELDSAHEDGSSPRIEEAPETTHEPVEVPEGMDSLV